MNNIDDMEVEIKRLFSCYPNIVAETETYINYTRMLMDIPIETLRATIDQATASCKFVPSIAELREIASKLTTTENPPATMAWGEVCSKLGNVMRGDAAIRQVLGNPIAQKVADAIGWRRLYFYKDYCQQLFIQGYNNQVDIQKTYALMPPDVRRFKEQAQLKQLGDGAQSHILAIEEGETYES